MSADEFDCVAADDGMEAREKGERPVSVSDEAVEKAARAIWETIWSGDWEGIDDSERESYRRHARVALIAALPVIERDLRETIAKGIEEMDGSSIEARDCFTAAAARVREGGRA